MLPFEFAVIGTPVSQQSRNRQRLREWQDLIRARARRRAPHGALPVTERNVRMVISYYYDVTPIDVDNIGKPVLDALKGLVYADDSQITDLRVRKRNLAGSFRIRRTSLPLAEGFASGREFLHVHVDRVPDE